MGTRREPSLKSTGQQAENISARMTAITVIIVVQLFHRDHRRSDAERHTQRVARYYGHMDYYVLVAGKLEIGTEVI